MNDQHNQGNWYLLKLENDHIQIAATSTQWNPAPTHSFPCNPEGIKAARAWLDTPTEPQRQLDQPSLRTITQPTTKKQLAANAGAKIIGYIIGFIVVSGIIAAATNWWNNNHYNSTYDNNFLTSCENNGGAAATCGCALNAIHQQFSYQQAKQFDAYYASTGTLPQNVSDAVAGCIPASISN